MSGHSKWAQIKRKKAVVDAKRGKYFTKLIREITVAARAGGGNEESNSRLRQVILTAKSANMPLENIKRAIQRGTGELPGVTYEEVVFEGYGLGGVAIIMEVTTDNRKRTVAEIRHIMSRHGGNLGESGCVAWMFQKAGIITLDKKGVDEDALVEFILEAGGEDFREEEDVFEITTSPDKLLTVREKLSDKGFSVKSAELSYSPKNTVKVSGSNAVTLLKLLDELENHDDVQRVSSNFDMDEQVLAGVE